MDTRKERHLGFGFFRNEVGSILASVAFTQIPNPKPQLMPTTNQLNCFSINFSLMRIQKIINEMIAKTDEKNTGETEKVIVEFQQKLNEHSSSLMNFIIGFATLYGTSIKDASIIGIRNRTFTDCEMFVGIIIPPCRQALLQAKEYFDYFDGISFEDFKEISENVIEDGEKSLELLQLSQNLITSALEAAHVRKTEANTVTKMAEKEIKKLEKKKERMLKDIEFCEQKKKDSITAFSNIPYIGGLIAGWRAGNLNDQIQKKFEENDKHQDQIDELLEVTFLIDDVLLPAIKAYEGAINGMIYCFSYIKNQGKSVIEKMIKCDNEESSKKANIFFKIVGIQAKRTTESIVSTIAFLELFDSQLQTLSNLDEAQEITEKKATVWLEKLKDCSKQKSQARERSLFDIIASKQDFNCIQTKLASVAETNIKSYRQNIKKAQTKKLK